MKVVFCAVAFAAATVSWTQSVPSSVHALHRPLDELLDIYVRDGFVYYNALRIDRAKLDQYVGSLNSPAASALANGSRDERKRSGSTPTTRWCCELSSTA